MMGGGGSATPSQSLHEGEDSKKEKKLLVYHIIKFGLQFYKVASKYQHAIKKTKFKIFCYSERQTIRF